MRGKNFENWVYTTVRTVYNLNMDTNTTTQPISHAAALVDNMIARATADIQSVNSSLDQALATLEERTARAQLMLTSAAGIFQPGFSEAAARVETLINQREAAYRELRSLEHVRKAC